MSYEDNYDQTARWDAESVREAEQRTQHRSTRSSAERQKLKKKGQRRRFTLWLAFVLITSAILAAWLAARRTILPRMASCGATRCMTGPTTSVPTMPGGCAACAMR